MHEIYDGCIIGAALFAKRFVIRSSVSPMISSCTKMLRFLASKEVGSPSSRCKLGMSRFLYADCHSPYYHITRSCEGSIITEAFRSNRATNVVLPQPVGPATMHVKGCFQRGSISVNEFSSGCRVLLLFQRRCAATVGEYFALPIEVG